MDEHNGHLTPASVTMPAVRENITNFTLHQRNFLLAVTDDKVNDLAELYEELGASILKFHTKFGWTALHYAAYHNSRRCASKMIQWEPAYGRKDQVRWTAITIT